MTDRMTRNEDFGLTIRRFLFRSRGSRQAIALCDVEKGETHFHLGSQHSSNLEDRNRSDSQVDNSNQSNSKSNIMNRKMSVDNSDKNMPLTSSGNSNNSELIKCSLCLGEWAKELFYPLISCDHLTCRHCLIQYLTIEITESRINIACPQCSEAMHPRDIHLLLSDYPHVYEKYEDFMVRRVLASDPDTRWCPAPDCSYAVIATGCASCPLLKCERPNCGSLFCYHCKAEWHPDQTCDAARITRNPLMIGSLPAHDIYHRDDIKPCPRCRVLIVKMDDGSCNHMMCAVCGAEFCWLCMKEITDLHYLSPSGCTFWGKKPWSRKKKLLWQLGTLVGAPIGIGLVAGIAIPAMIIGIPVWVGRKLHARYRPTGKHKRMGIVTGGVLASIIISPVLAGLAVAIGVPILLFYVYGVVPVSLCRAGGCGVTTSATGVKFEFDEEDIVSRNQDSASVDTASRIGGTSIGEVSLSFGGPTCSDQITIQGSTMALAGSIVSHRLEVQADLSSETASAVTCLSEKSGQDAASTKALAGSILSYRHHGENSEDCGSERVRFDDTVSYIHGDPPDKTSLCSIMSLREESDSHAISNSKRYTFSRQADDKPTIKPISKAAMLRNMFFQANMTEDKNNQH